MRGTPPALQPPSLAEFAPPSPPPPGAVEAAMLFAPEPPPPPPPDPAALEKFLQTEGRYSPREARAIAAAPAAERGTLPLPPPGFGARPAPRGGRPAPSKLDAYLASQYGPDVTPPKEPLGIPETSAERSTQYQLDEAELENAQSLFDAQERAREDIQAAQQKQLAAQEAADAAAQEQARQRTEHLRSMEARFEALADAAANEPIDSNRLWNDKSTGEKVLSFLALGLAGGAVGGAEGAQWALSRLDTEVQRDIDEQKANKGLLQNRMAAQESLVGMARARFASEAEQDAAMREILYRRAAVELEKSSAFAQRPERQEAFQALRDGIEQRQLGFQQARRLASDHFEMQRRAAMAGGGPPDPLKLLRREAEAVKLQRQIAGEEPGDIELQVPGLGKARSKMDAKEMRELQANYLETRRNLAKARDILAAGASRGVGALGYGTEEYHAADSLTNQIVTGIAKSYGGIITESDRESARREFPDLTAYGRGAEARLDAAERKLENRHRALIQAKIIGGKAPITVSREP